MQRTDHLVYLRMKMRISLNLKMMFSASFQIQLMGHVIGYNLEMEYLSKCGNLHSSVMLNIKYICCLRLCCM